MKLSYTLAIDFYVPPGSIDTSFHNIMDSSVVDGGNPATLTLEGLTVGAVYQVQLFVSDDRGGTSSRTQRFGDGEAAESFSDTFTHGDSPYVIGTFMADATTQDITINGVAQVQHVLMAYVLRDVTASIPTLSEWGMIILIGLVVLVMGRRMLQRSATSAQAAS